MLQNIHEKIQGWFATTILSIIVISFALFGIQSYIGNGQAKDVVAKVNGIEITAQQLTNAYDHLRQGALNPAAQAKLKQLALQNLITTQVLTSAAIKQGYYISPAQLDDVLMQLPDFQVDGKFSPTRFQQILDALGYSQQQLLAQLQHSLLINQMQSGVISGAFSLPNEVQQLSTLLNQKRDIAYATIPVSRFLPAIKVPEADIAAYYQQHQDAYKTPEQVSLQYIELSAAALANQITITPQQAQEYYQNNLSSFQIKGKTENFAQVNSQIIKLLKQQQLQKLFSDDSQRLSDLTYTNANSLEPAAKALGLSVQSTNLFTQVGEKSGITANKQVIAAAFSDDVLKNNNNSNVIPLNDTTVIVLRVKDHQAAAVKPLADVKAGIKQQLSLQMAQQQAQQYASKIIAELKNGAALKTVASQYHLTWQSQSNITRQSTKMPEPLLQAAFNIPKPTSNGAAVTTATLTNGDVALIAVQAVHNVTTSGEQTSSQHIHMANQIQNAYAQLDYQLYVAQMMNAAKIKIL